jgi:hypothetical protein
MPLHVSVKIWPSSEGTTTCWGNFYYISHSTSNWITVLYDLLLFTTRKSTYSKFCSENSCISLKQSTNVLCQCWFPPLLQCVWTEPATRLASLFQAGLWSPHYSYTLLSNDTNKSTVVNQLSVWVSALFSMYFPFILTVTGIALYKAHIVDGRLVQDISIFLYRLSWVDISTISIFWLGPKQ